MRQQRVGAELGMLNNLFKRQMACMAEAEDNITGMQAMIVHHLAVSRQDGDLFQRDIENFFQMRRSTATGILQLMEQHGLLRREPVAHDGRLKRLVLTEQAWALESKIERKLQALEELMRDGIDEEELLVWFRVCGRLRANLERGTMVSEE